MHSIIYELFQIKTIPIIVKYKYTILHCYCS